MSTPSESADALRTAQKPLKDKYKTDPSSALVTLTSTGTLSPSSLTCSLSTSASASRIAGLHAAAGGHNLDPTPHLCSGDMLLESLVACFGVTVRAVGTALAIPIHGGSVTAEGDLDFRGTLGVKPSDPDADGPVPVGFQRIRLHLRLDVDDQHKEQVDKLISLSERYCVVLQTLRQGVSVETKLAHVGKAVPDTRKDGEVDAEDDVRENEEGPEATLKDEEVLPVQ